MFCSQCGNDLGKTDRFCPKCGTAIGAGRGKSEKPLSSRRSNSEGQLDRDALILYLHDVLILEYMSRRLKRRLVAAGKYFKNSCLQAGYLYTAYVIPPNQRAYWAQDGTHYQESSMIVYFRHKGSTVIQYATERNKAGLPRPHYNTRPYELGSENVSVVDSSHEYVDVAAQMGSLMDDRTFSWDGKAPGIFDGRRRNEVRDERSHFFDCYENLKRTADEDYAREMAKNAAAIKKRERIDYEYVRASNLLEKYYAINIIPSQFRNLYAVYYLHQFISTSSESLTTALLHFDLNEIKRKLDRIIHQQEEILLNQAIMEYQNERLVNQNQEHLKRLEAIEENSARAAQNTSLAATYASIAACNAEICAWISIANYLK